MTMPRFLAGLMLALLLVTAARAQNAPDTIRFGFFPPLDEDIVYRVDYRHERTFGSSRQVVDWTHELHMRLTAKEPPDLIAGTFSIRGVAAREGAGEDIHYLIAKAVEGETYGFKMLQHGAPVETDWPAIKARIAGRVPQLTEKRFADVIVRALSVFEPDGVQAVMRPFWATSVGHLRAFNRDGTTATTPGLNLPAWYEVPGSTLETYGGRDEESNDYFIAWRITPPPGGARDMLGGEMRGLAEQVSAPSERAEVQALIDKMLAGDVEILEGAVATYDPKPGLMRKIDFAARMVAGDFRRDTTMVITRLKPQ